MSLGWPGNASGPPPEELEEVSGDLGGLRIEDLPEPLIAGLVYPCIPHDCSREKMNSRRSLVMMMAVAMPSWMERGAKPEQLCDKAELSTDICRLSLCPDLCPNVADKEVSVGTSRVRISGGPSVLPPKCFPSRNRHANLQCGEKKLASQQFTLLPLLLPPTAIAPPPPHSFSWFSLSPPLH
ncbi:hypothetical protein L3Q82_011617 [Scortum barcoo]|uniref:Uncharacterized protein n=1 Tax=Scortum barcoo TaxID=214431 RepID=A0ACB8W4J0_9TELE|nr:hypothetical protein L3Q82_011617 [Scortum barcoo]